MPSKQTEFTQKIISLIKDMIASGESPMIHDVHRSPEEQYRLYLEGKSNCDGYNILSAHEKSCAMDIYFVEDGKLVDPILGYEHWHDIWQEQYGGKPMIEWDKNHWE